MNPTTLALSAAGFDLAWLNAFSQKHGAEALELLLVLLRTGITPQSLVRVAQWGGKLALEVFVHYLGLDVTADGATVLFGTATDKKSVADKLEALAAQVRAKDAVMG